jgi:hypothetical protein
MHLFRSGTKRKGIRQGPVSVGGNGTFGTMASCPLQ